MEPPVFFGHIRRKPVHPDVTEEMIIALVHGFYDKVRTDKDLGPVFDKVVDGNWDRHLDRMCDFWSSVMLKTARFKGNPMQKHKAIEGLTPELFARWLVLFRQTAPQYATEGAAQAFIEKAEMIAASLQQGIFFKPARLGIGGKKAG